MKIRAENLVKIYNDRTVVNDISIEVNKGEVVGLLGPNGAGKTTTFYMVVGLVRPNSGKIFVDDTDLTNLTMDKRARHGIGYLPQETSIFRKLSVEDNIKLVLELNEKLTVNEKKKKLEELLDEFRIKKLRDTSAVALSGGERRRVEIARALINNPKVILADEPTSNLDPENSHKVMRLLQDISKSGTTVLLSTHELEYLSYVDTVFKMDKGNLNKV